MPKSKREAKQRQYPVLLGDRGRFVLPREVRDFLKVEEGDLLSVVLEDDGSARLVGMRASVEKAKGMFAHVSPKRKLADELLQERREEASDD